MGFKENLKTLRMERGIGQNTLATALCVSLKTISHWETGYSEPSIAQLTQIARVFEISLDELVED